MPGDLHQELVHLGERWFKREGFGVVAAEVVASGSDEQADVIGFRSTCSAIVEAKASRADFLVDSKKPHRTAGGLGVYRFYLCPPGIIEIEDLPHGWGLLYASGRRVTEVLRPTGNVWPAYGVSVGDWAAFQHLPDARAERAVLYSIARRRSLSRSDERYERRLLEAEREVGRLARANDVLAEKNRKLELDLYLARNGGQGQQQSAIRRKIA
ncbi:hypothetical protein [Ralstonia insidiosa]|jgi:hypothetical protein|nr:hypothetical protein [Ralstonia insidiosa]MBA9939308.1 hypothetical protein [Ralstonia insidiosa]MBC9968081.1 hypothetical protein [Ralstonia insidiosa]MBX3904356.1 hypothetical protein [Ralstonia insidiosa]